MKLPKYPYTGRRFTSTEAFRADHPIMPFMEMGEGNNKRFKVNPDWLDAPFYEVLDYGEQEGYFQRLIECL